MGFSTTKSFVDEDLSPAHLLYGLMSGFALFLLPLLVALLINFNQQNSFGTIMDSHLRWQRSSMVTFLMGCVIAYLIVLPWLSFSVFVLSVVWFVHRIIKGWLSLVDGQFIS